MDNHETFMSVFEMETLFTQFPISLIWKKYVMNVNITQIECNPRNVTDNKSLIYDCAFDQFQDMKGFITTAVDKNWEGFYRLPSDENQVMLYDPSYLILNEIAKTANKSLFTYFYDGQLKHDYNLRNTFSRCDQIDIADCKPCDYYREVVIKSNLSCNRPLYLSNQISFFSSVDKAIDHNSFSILSVYHWNTWTTLLLIIFSLIFISSIRISFRRSFWAHFDQLFGKGSPFIIKSISYGAYILALIPFLEIIRNELLANLVAVEETSIDTIDDLLNPKAIVFMWADLDFLREENRKLDDDFQLKQKLDKLFNKIGKRSGASGLLKFVSNPDEVKRIRRNLVIASDQYTLRWIEAWTNRLFKVRHGARDLFPTLISEFCYKREFEWNKLADKISQIYFETGLHYFYIDAHVTLSVLVAGRVLDLSYEIFPGLAEFINSFLLLDSQSVWSELKLNDFEATFSLFGYSTIICSLVFLFEIIFFIITYCGQVSWNHRNVIER